MQDKKPDRKSANRSMDATGFKIDITFLPIFLSFSLGQYTCSPALLLQLSMQIFATQSMEILNGIQLDSAELELL